MLEDYVIIGQDYQHKGNDRIYTIKDVISSEHPDTGEWYIAVLYYDISNNDKLHSRKLTRFIESFNPCK